MPQKSLKCKISATRLLYYCANSLDSHAVNEFLALKSELLLGKSSGLVTAILFCLFIFQFQIKFDVTYMAPEGGEKGEVESWAPNECSNLIELDTTSLYPQTPKKKKARSK